MTDMTPRAKERRKRYWAIISRTGIYPPDLYWRKEDAQYVMERQYPHNRIAHVEIIELREVRTGKGKGK